MSVHSTKLSNYYLQTDFKNASKRSSGARQLIRAAKAVGVRQELTVAGSQLMSLNFQHDAKPCPPRFFLSSSKKSSHFSSQT